MSREATRLSRGKIALIGALAAAAFIFVAAPAAQADEITSDKLTNTFTGGPFQQSAGQISSYLNPLGSNAPHNVVATGRGPDGVPLFSSGTLSPGDSAPLPGTQYLSPGTYAFVCTLHEGMADELIVTGGTPAPRPEIGLKIPRQKLKAVRKSGTLAVDVKGVNEATGVSLSISKGKKVLGKASGISVATSTTLTVSVKLSSAGKKAIKSGRKAAVTAKGSLAFGKTVTAKRTLR
jgi:plastocyanin